MFWHRFKIGEEVHFLESSVDDEGVITTKIVTGIVVNTNSKQTCLSVDSKIIFKDTKRIYKYRFELKELLGFEINGYSYECWR